MAQIDVHLWEIVRDWVYERYNNISVSQFPSEGTMPEAYGANHLGRITFCEGLNPIEEIGFVAPKGIMIWNRSARLNKKFEYDVVYPKDPQMFEKLEKLLEPYESKRSK